MVLGPAGARIGDLIVCFKGAKAPFIVRNLVESITSELADSIKTATKFSYFLQRREQLMTDTISEIPRKTLIAHIK
jgi:hypothetical protein